MSARLGSGLNQHPLRTSYRQRRRRAPRKFHFFEALPVQLQVLIIEKAFYADLEELNVPPLPNDLSHTRKLQGLHIGVTGNAFEVVDIDKQRYNTLKIRNVPRLAPHKAPRLFELYAVNSFFRKELDRISGGNLFFAFQPDFQWWDNMNVVYFDPLRMVLKIHFLSEEPDFRKIPNVLSRELASRATMVQVLCSYDVIENQDKTYGQVYRAFHAQHGEMPKRWIDQIITLFPETRVASAAWWGVGALWGRTNRPDNDGITRPRVFR